MTNEVARNANEQNMINQMMNNHSHVLKNLSEFAYDPRKDRVGGIISIHPNHWNFLLDLITENYYILTALDWTHSKVMRWIEINRLLYEFIENDFYLRKLLFLTSYSIHEDVFCDKFLEINSQTLIFMGSKYSVAGRCYKIK